MNEKERHIARIMFKNRVLSSDGQAFETLFTQVMGYASPDFIQIKPQGKVGDRKNDGYNRKTGHYFQVYSPEDPGSEDSKAMAVSKLGTDFAGLRSFWNDKWPINSFSFAFNDKYKGSFPTIEADLLKLKAAHSLEICECFLAKHLEDQLFGLDADKILSVVGGIPDPEQISNLDYSVLGEVLRAINEASAALDMTAVLTAPDFDEKLRFNGLGVQAATFLRLGSYQRGSLDDYFARNSTFAKQELRDAINRVYLDVSGRTDTDLPDGVTRGDLCFFEMLQRITPSQTRPAQDAAIVVMSYFFESCDIFDDPNAAGGTSDASA